MAKRRMRLLLVEDNPDHVEMIQRHLPSVGDEVVDWTCMERLAPAIEYLRHNEVDVVLLDLNLPDADRWQALEGTLSHAGDTAIIVLTSLDDQEFALHAVQEGAQDYLVKANIDEDRLSRAVRYSVERKRIEKKLLESQEALREGEARIRAVIDSAQDCIITIDPDETIVEFNPAAEVTFGCSRQQAIGKCLGEHFLSPEYRAEQRRHIENYLRNGDASPLGKLIETQAVRMGGETFVAELVVQPVRTSGQLLFTIFLRDITERKANEVKLKQYAAELERSNSDLDRFSSVVAHDLVSPLRAVSSYCQLVRTRHADHLDDEGREFLDSAIAGTKRMHELIQGLREYSRVSRGEKVRKDVDLCTLFKAVVENLKVPIEESQATVTCDECLPTIACDQTQMLQLFQNLIGNAIKYRDTQPPKVHVGAAQSGSGWQFSVSDNGIGIEAKYADRIFEMFQRLHADETQYSGTGVGLAVCKRIVERHGGRISFESKPGGGTTFYFTIPVPTKS